MSWQRTAEILFKPFTLKKWIMLGIIVLLAGQIGGFNFNIKGDKNDFNKIAAEIAKQASSAPSQAITIEPEKSPLEKIRSLPILNDPKKAIPVVLAAGVIIMLLGLIIFLWMWVNANFSFVFIDSVVRNDASLRVPFHRNKPQGNSYLMWNIIFSSVAALILIGILIPPIAAIAKSGMLDGRAAFDILKIFAIIKPYLSPFLIIAFLLMLIALTVLDFILPIMYKRKTGILKAWAEFLRIFPPNAVDIVLYFLLKLALAILAILVSIAIIIAGVILALSAAGICGLLGWLIYIVTPQAAKAVILAILVIVGVCVITLLAILLTLLFLPIPVFFRIFPIYFLSSIDESLDLFALAAEEKEADAGRYKKSMALVWFTVLSPLIVIAIFLAVTLAIPFFAGANGKPRFTIEERKPSGIESRQVRPAKKTVDPKDELVTIYLKNGNSFKAKIEEESANNISFGVEGGTFILPRSDILRIER